MFSVILRKLPRAAATVRNIQTAPQKCAVDIKTFKGTAPPHPHPHPHCETCHQVLENKKVNIMDENMITYIAMMVCPTILVVLETMEPFPHL